jgi:glycosyltransferase involved in cell wall biosynthesis
MSLSFSVITPSYGQGDFIEQTIQSVLSQAEVDFEYMVCDGGSSDNTLTILRKYQSHLRWVSEPDGGQADAVNKGIRNTTGDIIAWINSDDVYYPLALSKVRHIFETFPDVRVIYGKANHIDQAGNIIRPYPTEAWNYKRLKEVCFICQPATFFRRQLVEDQGYLDTQLEFCMDYELWLRYGRHENFFYSPEVLAGSRLYPGTKTSKSQLELHFEINEMLRDKFTLSTEKWVFAYAAAAVEENDKSRDRHSFALVTQFHRLVEFLTFSWQGYSRWRDLNFSPLTAWEMFRCIAGRYYNRHNPLRGIEVNGSNGDEFGNV